MQIRVWGAPSVKRAKIIMGRTYSGSDGGGVAPDLKRRTGRQKEGRRRNDAIIDALSETEPHCSRLCVCAFCVFFFCSCRERDETSVGQCERERDDRKYFAEYRAAHRQVATCRRLPIGSFIIIITGILKEGKRKRIGLFCWLDGRVQGVNFQQTQT